MCVCVRAPAPVCLHRDLELYRLISSHYALLNAFTCLSLHSEP